MDPQELLKVIGASGEKSKPGESDSPLSQLTSLIEKLGNDLSAKIDAVQSHTDKKLHDMDKTLGRVRGMVKGNVNDPSAEGGQAETTPKANTSSAPDTLSILKLGATLGKLPPKARRHLEAKLEDGSTVGEILAAAEFLDQFGGGATPESGGDDKAGQTAEETTITGRGATPPDEGAPAYPATQLEYVKLAQSDPKRWADLQADPNFDPQELKQG